MKERIVKKKLKVVSFRFPEEYITESKAKAKEAGLSLSEWIWRKLQESSNKKE